MFDPKIVRQGLAYAAGAALYMALVATLMNNAQRIIGPAEKGVLAPIGFLLLLVVSAATMGALIFGKPVMLYMDGQKREAVMMLACTICSLAAFTILLFVVLAATRG